MALRKGRGKGVKCEKRQYDPQKSKEDQEVSKDAFLRPNLKHNLDGVRERNCGGEGQMNQRGRRDS